MSVVTKLRQKFEDVAVEDRQAGQLSVKLRTRKSIGYVFGVMESLRPEVEEYSASQTSLESIFNLLAQQKGIQSRKEKSE